MVGDVANNKIKLSVAITVFMSKAICLISK